MKKTRFEAACSGLFEKAKGIVCRKMIENALKSNELNVEAKLYDINDKKNKLVQELAKCDSSCIKEVLQSMAALIQEEKELIESKNLSSEILAILDEEIEIENQK